MKPHEQRVVDEKEELDSKRVRLIAFIGTKMFYSLDIAEQIRLQKQLGIMKDYSELLAERIAAFR